MQHAATSTSGSSEPTVPPVPWPESINASRSLAQILQSSQEFQDATALGSTGLISGSSGGMLTPRFSQDGAREEDEEEAELEREIAEAANATEAAHTRLRDALAKLQLRRSWRGTEPSAQSIAAS